MVGYFSVINTNNHSKGKNIIGNINLMFISKNIKCYVTKDNTKLAHNNDIVKCKVKSTLNNQIMVEIISIVGSKNDVGIDITSFVEFKNWPTKFSDKTLEQCNKCNKPVSEADKNGRTDYTKDLIITIDGDDTRDYDDAINVKKIDDNYILSVHIADVSNYVQYKSATDKEAYLRGVSLYLPDRTYPMLPVSLSNGICSLNEGVERLTLSCIMTIDKFGNVIDARLNEGYINVSRRMTYNEVYYILKDKFDLNEYSTDFVNDNITKIDYEDKVLFNTENSYADKFEIYKQKYSSNKYSNELIDMLKLSLELANILFNKRQKEGSVDFDLPETDVILDSYGVCKSINLVDRNFAHKIIEEFMLQANECVSKIYHDRLIPFIYRIHEKPQIEKLSDFLELIKDTKYSFPNNIDEITSNDFKEFLKCIKDTEDEKLLSKSALRTMSQARYSDSPDGHFALAKTDYSHFTSPIRRYPDLMIHRIIHDDIRGRLNEDKINFYNSILNMVSLNCSENERLSMDIERKVDRMKIAEFMSNLLGYEFNATISSVTEWGFYVELANLAEGLVHINTLNDDNYLYDENKLMLYGENTGRIFKLGNNVKVKLINANKELGLLDFNVIID